jgi:hypothetical protein
MPAVMAAADLTEQAAELELQGQVVVVLVQQQVDQHLLIHVQVAAPEVQGPTLVVPADTIQLAIQQVITQVLQVQLPEEVAAAITTGLQVMQVAMVPPDRW